MPSVSQLELPVQQEHVYGEKSSGMEFLTGKEEKVLCQYIEYQ